MLRRSVWWLSGGGLKEYHDWHLREPLLQNYEGWRVLDHPTYDSVWPVYTYDIAGHVRHLDPIIDDPRLTHKQRVCRLYRWALLETQMWLTSKNAHKFNLAYKVVRRRFERYRYVTDPATCDMMVRETQKYLRDIACPEFLRNNATSPNNVATLTQPMLHPDNAQVYDHWTQTEVQMYDDAKLHRWNSHHPNYSGRSENFTRFYDEDNRSLLYRLTYIITGLLMLLYAVVQTTGVPIYLEDTKLLRKPVSGDVDEEATAASLGTWHHGFHIDLANALYAEERSSRTPGNSMLRHDWDRILGLTTGQPGLHTYELSHLTPEEVRDMGRVKLSPQRATTASPVPS